MTLLAYERKNLRSETLDIIAGICQIVAENEGYSLTVRQIHYQFVSKGWLPNNGKTYGQIQGAAKTGRRAGLISWTAIEDRGRQLMGLQTWETPQAALRETLRDYRTDMWANQPWRPEVWVEKQALEGVIGQIANKLRVDFYAQKGYDSESQSWRAGQRFARYIQKGQRPTVFHLGDHDPSGRDMTRDNQERLSLFAGTPIIVQRLALNLPQIREFNPPPNFTKDEARSDSYRAYMVENGADPDSSWELDALRPPVIQDIIERAILKVRDPELWDQALRQEVEDRRMLQEMMEIMGGGSSAGPSGGEED